MKDSCFFQLTSYTLPQEFRVPREVAGACAWAFILKTSKGTVITELSSTLSYFHHGRNFFSKRVLGLYLRLLPLTEALYISSLGAGTLCEQLGNLVGEYDGNIYVLDRCNMSAIYNNNNMLPRHVAVAAIQHGPERICFLRVAGPTCSTVSAMLHRL